MDKELAQLQKEVIKRLIEYEDELQAFGNVNQLKKTKRVSSSVAMNIAAFPDLVQNLLDSGVETAEISRKLRNFQESLLRDTVYIKGTETGHHANAQLRTGGDYYRAPPEIWQPATVGNKLSDFFETQFGDVPVNIRSYLNYVHKSDTNTKGIEAEVLGKTANPYKELTAHPMGTGPKSIIGNLTTEQLSDPDKFFDEMSKRIDAQVQASKVADELQRPLAKIVQENIDPRAYKTTDPAIISEIQKKILLPENRPFIKQGILEVVQEVGNVRIKLAKAKGGNVNFRAAGMGALGGFVTSEEAMTKLREGDYIGAAQSAGTEMAVGEVISQGVQKVLPKLGSIGRAVAPVARAIGPASLAAEPARIVSQSSPQRMLEARQRGGRTSVGFGSVRFTLPELGLSEYLGIN
jgi:hypothetical protein